MLICTGFLFAQGLLTGSLITRHQLQSNQLGLHLNWYRTVELSQLATCMRCCNLSQTIIRTVAVKTACRSLNIHALPVSYFRNAQSLTCPLDHLYKRTQQTESGVNLDCLKAEWKSSPPPLTHSLHANRALDKHHVWMTSERWVDRRLQRKRRPSRDRLHQRHKDSYRTKWQDSSIYSEYHLDLIQRKNIQRVK